MKSILVLITSLVVFGSVGLGAATRPEAAAAVVLPDIQIVNDVKEMAGTWQDFPNGLMIRFDGNGTVKFGLDANGTAIGFSGNAWFQEEQLFIEFNNFDNEDVSCATTLGVYQVRLLSNGGLTFAPLQDACQLRVSALSGRTEVELGPIFQPVK